MEQQLYTETQPGSASARGQNKADMSSVTWSITELAEEFGLTTRAIRFYEDKGLLSPERRGQTRIYHPRDRARLILIVRGKNVGLALAEIKEILSLYDQEDGCETQIALPWASFASVLTSSASSATKSTSRSRHWKIAAPVWKPRSSGR